MMMLILGIVLNLAAGFLIEPMNAHTVVPLMLAVFGTAFINGGLRKVLAYHNKD